MSKQYAKDQPAGFTNRLDNIAIIGASGQVGTHVVTALLKSGAHKKITAITREDSTSTFPPELAVARVNYDDEDSLVRALKGHDAFIITMHARAPAETHYKLVDAAVKAGVPWILPNEWGYGDASEPFERDILLAWKIAVRRRIEEKAAAANSGSSWLGMGCGFWIEYSMAWGEPTFGIDLRAKRAVFFGDGRVPITLSSLAQAGRGAAAVLALKVLPEDENDTSPTVSDYRNGFVRFGSFTVDQRAMFASALRVTGTQESEWQVEEVEAKPRWQAAYDDWNATHKNFENFGRAMYTRTFFAEDSGDMRPFGFGGKIDNERIGLAEEELDDTVKLAWEMVQKKKEEGGN